VNIGAYDEKSSGVFAASHGAKLNINSFAGNPSTADGRRSRLLMDNVTIRPVATDLNRFGAELVHRWSFNGDATDSVGAQAAVLKGACAYSEDGKAVVLAGGTYGSSYVDLGSDILPKDAEAVTIEMWARQDSATTWSRIFEIGINQYYFAGMCWNRNGTVDRDYIEIKHNNTGKSSMDGLKPYTLGVEYHIAITYYKDIDGIWKAIAYKQDAVTGETIAKTAFEAPEGWSLSTMYQTYCYLGRAIVSGGSDAAATYNEVRVWRGALTEKELSHNAIMGPDAEFGIDGQPVLTKTGAGTLMLEGTGVAPRRIAVEGGVLKLDAADVLPTDAAISIAFDKNGGHGLLSCAKGVLDLSKMTLGVRGIKESTARLMTSEDGFAGSFAKKALPSGYSVVISEKAVDIVYHAMVIVIR
jgi:hypothetical protein